MVAGPQILDEDEYRRLKAETLAAGQRLKKVSEVNRQLHGTLIKKKCLAEELRQNIDELTENIACAEHVELPARVKQEAELELAIRDEHVKHQASNLELGRGVMEREERAHELSAANQQLRDDALKNRTLLKEQQAEVREQQKQIREMERHIQIMEGELVDPAQRCESQSVTSDAGEEQWEAGPRERQVSPLQRNEKPAAVAGPPSPREGTAEPRSALRTISEYKQLPGLDIEQLLGGDFAVPGRSSSASSPTHPKRYDPIA
mmetsp:Transcript_29609/g.78403  ORF Transcript_29609/g.78403 Transcript_29609/m.78403 type:complete len:262 (+) Transcript_29609:42-827(+)